MSRYYIYDSVTDKVAEFARGVTPQMLGKMAGNTAKKSARGVIGRGALGVLAAGGTVAGGAYLANRNRKKQQSAPVDNSIKGRIKAKLAAAKSTASSGAQKVKAGARKLRGRQEA